MKSLKSIFCYIALATTLTACHSSGKSTQPEEGGIDSLAPNPFITHIYLSLIHI